MSSILELETIFDWTVPVTERTMADVSRSERATQMGPLEGTEHLCASSTPTMVAFGAGLWSARHHLPKPTRMRQTENLQEKDP